MAIYAVRNKLDGTYRLVDCSNNAQARKHVADDTLEVTVPNQRELVALIKNGVEVEQYGQEPAPQLTEPES